MNKEQQNTQPSRFNWGTGLAVAITLFVFTTLGVVGYLISLDFHVVAENYYEQAENYQQHIDRVEQSSELEEPVKIGLSADKKTVAITFPESEYVKGITGTVELYRPSDSSLDRVLKLDLNENRTQHIDAAKLLKGKWTVKLNWSLGSKEYYTQQNVFL